MRKNRNYNLIFGCLITALMVAVIIVGFFYTPYSPSAISAADKLRFPSISHILGTDHFGRDIFSRILEGAGTTLTIAAATVFFGIVVGLIIGAITGYFGGLFDEVLMRICDVITVFPSVLLALVLISIIGPGKYNVILALGILFVPSYAKVVRTQFARQKELDYVKSARLMGVGHFRIMFVHILPNIKTVLLSSIAIGFNNAVLAEASMSYLSIGVQAPDASLGSMLSESQSYFFSAPWFALSVGGTIILLILGFSLISEGLGDADRA